MRRLHSLLIAIFSFALLVCLAAPVAAQSNDVTAQSDVIAPSGDVIVQSEEREYSNARIVRLSLVDGEVQVFRPEAGEWEEARQNLPIQKAYAVATGRGRVEIEFESGATARLDESSELEFTELALIDGARVTELRLERGSAIFYANLAKHDAFLVRAAGSTINMKKNSRIRVSAEDAGLLVAVLKGEANVESDSGTYRVEKNQELRLGADGVAYARRGDDTEFEQWAQDREEVLSASYDNSRHYVNAPFRYGVGDLSRYGYWSYASGYGNVWYPHTVGFTPYVNGSWIWISGYGWSWVGYEPWGWLPYHYGRWVWTGFGWGWRPGHFRRWHPAHVWWVRFHDGSLGWCPRSPHDRPGRRPRHINTVTGVIGGRPAVRTGATPTVLAGPPTRDSLDLLPQVRGRNPRVDRAGRGPRTDGDRPLPATGVTPRPDASRPRGGYSGVTGTPATRNGDVTRGDRNDRVDRGLRDDEPTGRRPQPRGGVRFDRNEGKFVNDPAPGPDADAPAVRPGYSGRSDRPQPRFDRSGDAPRRPDAPGRGNGLEVRGNAGATAGANARGNAGNGSAPRNNDSSTPRASGVDRRGSRPDSPAAQRPSHQSQPRANRPPAQHQPQRYAPPPPQPRPSSPPPQARPAPQPRPSSPPPAARPAPQPRPSAPAARPQSSGQRPSSSMRAPRSAPAARPSRPASRPATATRPSRPAPRPSTRSPRAQARPSTKAPK